MITLPATTATEPTAACTFITACMEQAVRDANAAGNGDKPVVLMRKNGKETLAVMRLDDWFELYREWSQDV